MERNSNLKSAGLAGILATGLTSSALATDYTINPNMSVEQISGILSGLRGGDRLDAEVGQYVIPQIREVWLRINGNLDGSVMFPIHIDWHGSELIAQDTNSGLCLELGGYSRNVILENLIVKGARAGVKIGGDYDNITLDNVFFTDIGDKPIVFNNIRDSNPTTQASIWVQNSYIQFQNEYNSAVGIHFNKGQLPVNAYTKYVGGNNITIEYVGGVGIDAPTEFDENGHVVRTLGQNEFSDILVINSAEFFPPAALEGFGRNRLEPNGPFNNVEYNGIDPDYVSLADLELGVGNIEVPTNQNPKLVYTRDRWGNRWLAPIQGSPAIGEEHGLGYAGALPPVRVFTNARDSK